MKLYQYNIKSASAQYKHNMHRNCAGTYPMILRVKVSEIRALMNDVLYAVLRNVIANRYHVDLTTKGAAT